MGETVVTTEATKTFESDVPRRLKRLARRLRAYVLAGGIAQVCVFLLWAVAAQLLLDRTFRLPVDMRAVLLAIIVFGLVVILWRCVLSPWRFRLNPGEMACLVERRHPELKSVLVSAVQFSAGHVGSAESNSPELVDTVVRRASRQAAGISFDSVLAHGRARRSYLVMIAAVAVSTATVWSQPETMGMWFDRNVLLSDVQWPQRTRLRVDPPAKVLTVARGDDLEIRAHAEGEVPRAVDIIFALASGKTGRETMVSVGERSFRHTFSRVDEPFHFRLKGGDDETESYEVRLAERPRVEDLTIAVAPPAYARIEPYTAAPDQRAVETLLGSEVTLDIRLNKPVESADLVAGSSVVKQARGADDAWSVTIAPRESRTYQFALLDALGLENKRPARISVRIVKDNAPRVRMRILGVGDVITPHAILPLEMSFSDTYGLAEAEMVYTISREEAEPSILALDEFKPGATKFDSTMRWPVASLAVRPGERLSMFVRAEDFDDVSGPNEAQSAPITLRIVTTDELLQELARREQEYRQEFERVVNQQERLRGQLLTVIRRIEEPESLAGFSNVIAPLERRQRQIAGQVNLVRQQFEQILTELVINGLDTQMIRVRLEDRVIRPITRLAKRDLVAAADSLRNIARSPTTEATGRADATQVEILAEMRRILDNMLKWEGYQEAVTMLREILRLQRELNQETHQELDRRASELLDGS